MCQLHHISDSHIIPVFFRPSMHNFRYIELKFCICYQVPTTNITKSGNSFLKDKTFLCLTYLLITFMDLSPICNV